MVIGHNDQSDEANDALYDKHFGSFMDNLH